MARLWIGVVAALWLAAGVAMAGEEGARERRILRKPDATRPAERVPEPRTAPAPGDRDFIARQAPVPAAPAMRISPEPVPVVPAKNGEHGHVRAVCRLKAAPAGEVASTITGLLRAEGQAARDASMRNVVIVPDVVGNSLVIGGPPDAVAEVRQLIEQLDHRALMVRVEVVLVDVPAGAARGKPEGKGKEASAPAAEAIRGDALPEHSEVLVRAELTTLDNQRAHLQCGRREGRVVGSTMAPGGRANSVTFENVGTIVAITPRVGADKVVTMNIEVEDARLGPVEEGVTISAAGQGESVRTPNTETLTAKTTISVADGKTAVVAGTTRQLKSGKQRVLLVTPHVLRTSGGANR